MGGGYQHIRKCMVYQNIGWGISSLRKWLHWNVFIRRNVGGTVCVYFSEAVLDAGNIIIIRQDALVWSCTCLNGKAKMRSDCWMKYLNNVYVWCLKRYVSSLNSAWVLESTQQRLFPRSFALPVSFKAFSVVLQVIGTPTMEHHDWGCFHSFFWSVQASQANVRSLHFSHGLRSLFCSTWAIFTKVSPVSLLTGQHLRHDSSPFINVPTTRNRPITNQPKDFCFTVKGPILILLGCSRKLVNGL